MIELYPKQSELIDSLRVALRSNECVVAQASTGFGKTVSAAYMIRSAISKGKRVFFSVHRRELITQTQKTLDKFDVPYGYIAAGYPCNFYQPCQIISIDTAKNRIGKMPRPDLVIVDEGHIGLAAGWRKVIQHWIDQGAKIIMLTATPWRLDGSGLGEIAGEIVCGPSTRWLIENGFLSEYRLFAPPSPDLGNVHTRMGDYVRGELEGAMDKARITGDVIDHYRKHADGKRAVAFCVSIRHSRHVVDQFNAAGIPAEHMDGETPGPERKRIIRAFADGKIKVISNVEIITTGFDLAAQVDRDVTIEAIILLRPTQSLSLYLQMVGRGLRMKPDPAIILDHAGCALRHGLPCEERVWTLEGREKKPRASTPDDEPAVKIKQCEHCYFCFSTGHVCPNCGHVHDVGRVIKEVDGELAEVTEAVRIERQEQRQARTLDDLRQVAEKQGRDPKWADHVHKARQEKQQLRTKLQNLMIALNKIGEDVNFDRHELLKMKPKALRENIEWCEARLKGEVVI